MSQWQAQGIEQTMISQKGTPYLALMGEIWSVFCE